MARDFEDHCWKDIVSPEVLKIYEHYRRDVYVGARPALLAIDLYNLVYRGGDRPPHEISDEFPSTCGAYAWAAIEPTKRLFAAARAAKLPIFYTTAGIGQGRVVATNRQVGVDDGADDSFDLFEAVATQPDDMVVVKERASGFYGTALVAYLTRLGIDSLIVCGESTSGCVRASTVDGYSNGYHMTVVEECVFDRSELSHKVNLFDLHHKYADVMGIDEVVAHLEEMAEGRNAA
jgi:nicotinamidase-related amidase